MPVTWARQKSRDGHREGLRERTTSGASEVAICAGLQDMVHARGRDKVTCEDGWTRLQSLEEH